MEASSSCLRILAAQSILEYLFAHSIVWQCFSCRCGGRDFVPDREPVGDLGPPLGRAHQMPTVPKVASNMAKRKQKPLRLPRRSETLHHLFADPGRLMRVLSPIIQVLRLPMLHRGQKLAMR